jgi:hypothetical protein
MLKTINAEHQFKNFADIGVRNKKGEIIETVLKVKLPS